MFLSPKGSLIASIVKMYEKSKYVILINLAVAVFQKNDIEEGYPPSYQNIHLTQRDIQNSWTQNLNSVTKLWLTCFFL